MKYKFRLFLLMFFSFLSIYQTNACDHFLVHGQHENGDTYTIEITYCYDEGVQFVEIIEHGEDLSDF